MDFKGQMFESRSSVWINVKYLNQGQMKVKVKASLTHNLKNILFEYEQDLFVSQW